MSKNDPAERAVRDICRKTRKQYSAEEKIRIVVSGPARRGQHRRAVSPGGDRRESLLQLVGIVRLNRLEPGRKFP